jgi:hypothetical protein
MHPLKKQCHIYRCIHKRIIKVRMKLRLRINYKKYSRKLCMIGVLFAFHSDGERNIDNISKWMVSE